MNIKYLALAILLLGLKQANAQTGIGTSNPDNSSQLDITSSIRGLLIPRIELTSTTSQSPIPGVAATSLLVYNKSDKNDITPGFYYWNGIKWVRIAEGDTSSSTGNVMDIKVINSNYTIAAADYTIIASQMTEDITINLPDAVTSKGRILVINQANITNNAGDEVTVKFNLPVIYSDTFSRSELATAYYAATGGTLKVTLQSDGVNWYTVSSL
ncbi:hypothetical protein [[Flexibacter] sp. ATCC 35103]|uniref:hypothetical protein n=1 Tax=[Flexibacter] sp. ATCC 35103 TaxID=1937528 RepID=UPI0009C656DC|nr:hypothetical protein [[Flexibacter] sp. ATCC 35103]OMQ10481.1 hypothetical protein BXU01_14490 [[Flexibacter] sp. ATCC 35103]